MYYRFTQIDNVSTYPFFNPNYIYIISLFCSLHIHFCTDDLFQTCLISCPSYYFHSLCSDEVLKGASYFCWNSELDSSTHSEENWWRIHLSKSKQSAMFVRVLNSFHSMLQELYALAESIACSSVEGLWNSALALYEHATTHTALRLGLASENMPAIHATQVIYWLCPSAVMLKKNYLSTGRKQ